MNTLRIPIVSGRDFASADVTRPVVLVNQSMARRYWPDENPVGKTLILRQSQSRGIVGVVRNAHTDGLDEIAPTFYQPLNGGREVPKLLLRTSGRLPASDIVRLVARLGPRVRVQTMALSENLERRLAESRIGPDARSRPRRVCARARPGRHVRRLRLRGATADA